jgi:hypothetical protein
VDRGDTARETRPRAALRVDDETVAFIDDLLSMDAVVTGDS